MKPKTIAKTCGQCKHWERAKPYTWGECIVILPIWCINLEPPRMTLFPGSIAKDCDCFEERECERTFLQTVYDRGNSDITYIGI